MELCDPTQIGTRDLIERIGKVHHEIAEAIGPNLVAQPCEGTPRSVELRGEEEPCPRRAQPAVPLLPSDR
jgi:hypothetical protein